MQMMKKETIEKIKEILTPFGYKIHSNEFHTLYIEPNYNEYVHVTFVDGLFKLELWNKTFSTSEAEQLTKEIEKYENVAKVLNKLLEDSGDKKESILNWQKKIDGAGLGLNQNGFRKFWDIAESYGIFSHTNGSPEFTELWLWNEENYTIILNFNEDKKIIDVSGGLYDEEGNPIGSVSTEELAQKLKIKALYDYKVLLEMEEGLYLSITIDKEDPYYLEYSYVYSKTQSFFQG
jgi:hypothetical protein